jgi:putative PIN family toxin of toxin-antitoxin system
MIGLAFLLETVCLSSKSILHRQIIIVVTQQLPNEIKEVTGREKLKKYFPKESVIELIELLETNAEHVEITPTHFINRDPKDNFSWT